MAPASAAIAARHHDVEEDAEEELGNTIDVGAMADDVVVGLAGEDRHGCGALGGVGDPAEEDAPKEGRAEKDHREKPSDRGGVRERARVEEDDVAITLMSRRISHR